MNTELETTYAKQLFREISTGNEAAFQEVYLLYKKRALSAAYHITRSESIAEDVCQAMFLRLWDNRLKLEEINCPDAFIKVIITRLSIDVLEKRGHHRRYIQNVVTSASLSSNNNVIQKVDVGRLKEKILKISAVFHKNKREVLSLRLFDDLSYHEIGSRLNITEKTARLYYAEIMKHIKSQVNKIDWRVNGL